MQPYCSFTSLGAPRRQTLHHHVDLPIRAVLKGPVFFLLRTALKDRPKGPPTANRQLPSTANRHQPPTSNRQQRTANHPPPATNRRQPPDSHHYQPPRTTNRQPPTAANHLQALPTASCQPPTTHRHQPPTANRHHPWLSTWSARGLFWENWFRNTFFFPLRTALLPVLSKPLERRGYVSPLMCIHFGYYNK